MKTNKFKDAWWRVPASIRKPLIFMIGFAVVTAGIIMLVFPGPGWAAIFLGFAILATEFAFAERVRNKLIEHLKNVIHISKKKWEAYLNKRKHK